MVDRAHAALLNSHIAGVFPIDINTSLLRKAKRCPVNLKKVRKMDGDFK